MNVSLGYSPCPNDTFMFHALVHGLVAMDDVKPEVRIADVETLNLWALEGKLDITKLSFHTYLKVRDEYALLESGSALGFGVGPLLIAKRHLSDEEIVDGPIAIPGEHTTAHMLFRLRYPHASNKRFVIFSDVEEAVLSGEAVAGVIIHENRFTYADKGLVKLIDLGDYWEHETGTAIPLGAIVARRSLGPEVIASFDSALSASVRFAFENPQASVEYVRRYAQEMSPEVMRKHIETYVNDFSIALGQTGHRAINELETRAAAAGII